VIYDPHADRPLYLEVTPARVNDITPAKAMPIEPGATYVFDRLLRLRLLGEARCGRLPHRHPAQEEHAPGPDHRAVPAAGIEPPLHQRGARPNP
jgi:hypothetical protein